MTETRKWSALAVVLVAAIFAAGWFLLVSPKRSEAADLDAKTVSQDANNLGLEQKLKELQAQQADLPMQRALLAKIETNIPGNPALPSLIRDLTAAARKVGVDLVTLSPSPPQVVTPAVAAGAVAAPAPVTPAAAGSPVLYQVPLALTVTGSYFEQEQFLHRLEGLSRSLLVTGFTITASSSEEHPDDLSVAITGRVFLSSDAAPAAVAAAAPVAPATTN